MYPAGLDSDFFNTDTLYGACDEGTAIPETHR